MAALACPSWCQAHQETVDEFDGLTTIEHRALIGVTADGSSVSVVRCDLDEDLDHSELEVYVTSATDRRTAVFAADPDGLRVLARYLKRAAVLLR